MCVCVRLSVSPCVSLSVSVSLCLSVSLSLCVSLSLSPSLSLCLGGKGELGGGGGGGCKMLRGCWVPLVVRLVEKMVPVLAPPY